MPAEIDTPLTEEQKRLVADNVRLVYRAVTLLRKSKAVEVLGWQDATQEGMLCLIRCARNYDPTCGCTFSTYTLRSVIREIGRVARVKKNQPLAVRLGTTPLGDERDEPPARESAPEHPLLDVLQQAIKQLPPRDRALLGAYYGLGNRRRMTQRQIARKYRISAQRVFQLMRRAHQRLEEILEKQRVQARGDG